MRTGVAYKLTFPNGKVYVGITRETLKRRVQRHISYARAGKCFALSAAIRKHGEDSFVAEVVGYGTWDELKEIEIRLIAEYRAQGVGGYNMTGGGDGSLGVPVSDVVREKIAASLKGRTLSAEHRRRVGQAQHGKSIPDATKQKMRQAAIARCIRSPMSDEQKQKISASLSGRKQSKEHVEKRVAARKISTGNL